MNKRIQAIGNVEFKQNGLVFILYPIEPLRIRDRCSGTDLLESDV